MKALRLHGAVDARIDEIAEPPVRPGTVKIRVVRAGICGSDLGLYRSGRLGPEHRHPIMNEIGPKVLGHEFSGTVTEIGDEAAGIAVGDLVAVQPNIADGRCPACLRGEPNLCENYGFIGIDGWGGGFSEYVVAPADNVFVLPEGFTAETGALVEPLTVGWAAVRKSGAAAEAAGLIVGGGPVGLAILLSLRAIGASRIIVSEVSDRRKALAASLGAEVVDPRETDLADFCGAGMDVAFDASGAGSAAFDAAFRSLRTGGTLVVAASSREPVAVDTTQILTTEKRITGSFAYTRADFRAVIDAVAAGRLDPRPLVSSTIPLEQVIEGGLDHLLGDGRATEVKILVAPGSD